MALWTTPLRLADREVDARLRHLAKTSCRVLIEQDAEIKDPRSGSVTVQRIGQVQWRDVTLGLFETITPWSLQCSVGPVMPEAYAAILAMGLINGQPTAHYRDTYPDGRQDLTAWWVRPGIADGAAQVRHLLEHTARGYTWAPLDTEEVVRNARAAL